jgi:hypothetical protein
MIMGLPNPDPYQNVTDPRLYEDDVPLLKCTWSAREEPSRQRRSKINIGKEGW